VPASAIHAFSRRTAQIEAKAREQGITDLAEKAQLGAKTRAHKNEALSMEQLRELWRSRLTPDDKDAIAAAGRERAEPPRVTDDEAAHHAVKFALEHCFERRAVVAERRLLAVAIKHASGKASADAIGRQLQAENLLGAQRNGHRYLTTRAVLDEERHMLDFARAGRGACAPLRDAKDNEPPEGLSADQRKAVAHVLESRDRVILVRGPAGTGKTTMMRTAVAGIEAGAHKVRVFAPSADASRGVLRGEGFSEADTVARLLLDERMQERVRGQVVWVDEAGLLGTRTMERLFEVARRLDARVILSGDRRQHGSVERGAALSLLEDEAGLVPAQLRDIRRQHGAYKEAVRALSEGRTEAGFAQLDQLGWIRVVDDGDRDRAIAHDFVETIAAGKTALVVSPTHREGDAITAEIRSELKRIGRLRGKEHSILTLSNYNWTEAERADPGLYASGDVLAFHQNAKGYANGQRVEVGKGPVPVDQAARFQVFQSGSLAVAPGDILRVTRNGKTRDGKHRLNNGQLVTVKRFTRSGDLQLSNGWTIGKDFGHLAYGYVSTSHASQGKTIDQVFIGQSTVSAPASSREQFYVSVSRARERATIYTDDKEALLESVKRSEDRFSATELDRERRAHLLRLDVSDAGRARGERQLVARVAQHVR
jgi:RecA/RadA recombinase